LSSKALNDLASLISVPDLKKEQANRVFLYDLVVDLITKCGFPTEINLHLYKYDVLNKAKEEINKMDAATVEKVLSILKTKLSQWPRNE
jgi:hypothetical protein